MLNIDKVQNQENSILQIQKFDVTEHKNQREVALRQNQEVQNIISGIDVTDMKSILTFGNKPAQDISRFSDQILNSMQMNKGDDTGKMLTQLTKIMDKFDVSDFEKLAKQEPSFFEKIFGLAKSSVDALYGKYHTMGDEVEKVSIILREYETEIYQSGDKLKQMFEATLEYYEDLQKYIVAGDMAVEELKLVVLPKMEQKAIQSGDRMDELSVTNLRQLQEMFEQRVYDLRLAENIAMQSIPMIQAMQFNNYNLIRKINSAFIITLPVFKRCLAQAIMLKRQSVQAKATSAFDEKTKEMLIRNAQMTADQTKMIAQLSSGSFVDVDTLTKTWQTIMNGIAETKQIQENSKVRRIDDTKRLMEFKKQYENENKKLK